MAGGHWFVLQSIAWGRMFVTFARHDSLAMALIETFDGRHPCRLCVQIQEGRQQEAQKSEKLPWDKPEKMPELFCEARRVALPPASTSLAVAPPVRLDFFYHFVESPPKPPPRAGVAVL